MGVRRFAKTNGSARGVTLGGSLLAAAWGWVACLPGDTRPEPASLYFTAEPSAAVTGGLVTDDGWAITFDQLLVAIGNAGLDRADACNTYAEANYDRLFDFVKVERAKIGTAYGLGSCEAEIRFRAPSSDAIVGVGATQEDVAAMRVEDSDELEEGERTSVILRGRATRGDEQRTFDWWFRRSYELTDCTAADGSSSTSLELETGAAHDLRFEVRGEEFFRAQADDEAGFLFDPLAAADADGDGEVTLSEMSRAPRPLTAGDWAPQLADLDEGEDRGREPIESPSEEELTLQHYVYDELLPRLLRVAGGGRCAADLRGR